MAGWFGLLITAMNLFPVGQLDGGHAVFALSKSLHAALARLTLGGMVGLVSWSLSAGLVAAEGAVGARAAAAGAAGALAGVGVYAGWKRLPRAARSFAAIALTVFVGFCIARGVFSTWLVWTLILLFLGRLPHPPLESDAPVGAARKVLALAALAIFLLELHSRSDRHHRCSRGARGRSGGPGHGSGAPGRSEPAYHTPAHAVNRTAPDAKVLRTSVRRSRSRSSTSGDG